MFADHVHNDAPAVSKTPLTDALMRLLRTPSPQRLSFARRILAAVLGIFALVWAMNQIGDLAPEMAPDIALGIAPQLLALPIAGVFAAWGAFAFFKGRRLDSDGGMGVIFLSSLLVVIVLNASFKHGDLQIAAAAAMFGFGFGAQAACALTATFRRKTA
jgi:hypothetical protein